MDIHILQIERNAEGSVLAYLSPTDENGVQQDGYRIAGPKAWGGSENIAKLKISEKDLITYIKKYAPDICKKLIEDKE